MQLRDEEVELPLRIRVALEWKLRAGAIECAAQGGGAVSKDACELRKCDALRPGSRRCIEDEGLLTPGPQRELGLTLGQHGANGAEKVGHRLPAVRGGHPHGVAR